MADSLFDDLTKDQLPHFDEAKDYLEELIGPGGKFDVAKFNNDREAAIKAMAKGKAFADRTLDHRNKEFDELREQFLSRKAEGDATAKFEELFQKYMEGKQNNSNQKPIDEDKPTLDLDTVDKLLSQRMLEKDMREKEARNMAEVERRLAERFGENAKQVLRDRMNTLGLTADDIKSLVKRSPDVVLNALGVFNQQQETYQAPPGSSVRSDNFRPNVTNKRAASYWDKLKKSDPKKYWSPESSIQRMKDIDELGADFDDMTRRRL